MALPALDYSVTLSSAGQETPISDWWPVQNNKEPRRQVNEGEIILNLGKKATRARLNDKYKFEKIVDGIIQKIVEKSEIIDLDEAWQKVTANFTDIALISTLSSAKKSPVLQKMEISPFMVLFCKFVKTYKDKGVQELKEVLMGNRLMSEAHLWNSFMSDPNNMYISEENVMKLPMPKQSQTKKQSQAIDSAEQKPKQEKPRIGAMFFKIKPTIIEAISKCWSLNDFGMDRKIPFKNPCPTHIKLEWLLNHLKINVKVRPSYNADKSSQENKKRTLLNEAYEKFQKKKDKNPGLHTPVKNYNAVVCQSNKDFTQNVVKLKNHFDTEVYVKSGGFALFSVFKIPHYRLDTNGTLQEMSSKGNTFQLIDSKRYLYLQADFKETEPGIVDGKHLVNWNGKLILEKFTIINAAATENKTDRSLYPMPDINLNIPPHKHKKLAVMKTNQQYTLFTAFSENEDSEYEDEREVMDNWRPENEADTRCDSKRATTGKIKEELDMNTQTGALSAGGTMGQKRKIDPEDGRNEFEPTTKNKKKDQSEENCQSKPTDQSEQAGPSTNNSLEVRDLLRDFYCSDDDDYDQNYDYDDSRDAAYMG